MDPELRKRFVDSIEYLRKMDFFQDYSNLSSEEILDKIFNGKMDYMYHWQEKKGKPGHSRGRTLRESLLEYEDSWMKSSDAEIDYRIILFDTKRTICEDPETVVEEDMGITILNRLARISRGVFNPTNISYRWFTPSDAILGKWLVQEVSFDFKGMRHAIEIALQYDYFVDMGLYELNMLIKDTGYQYCQIDEREVDDIIVTLLTEEEAEKLKKERGWKFKLII